MSKDEYNDLNQSMEMPGNPPAGSARERLQTKANSAQTAASSNGAEAFQETEVLKDPSTDAVSSIGENDLSNPAEDGVFGTVQADDDAETMLALKSMEERRRKKRRSKIIRIVVCVLLVALIGAAVIASRGGAGAEGEDSIPVTGSVEKRDFVNQTQGTGKIEPYKSVVITPEVEGIIDSVSVTEGQTVESGQTLFTIKNDDLGKDVDSAQRDVDAAQRAVDSAQRSLDDVYRQMNDACNAHNDAVAKANAEAEQADAAYYEAYNRVKSQREQEAAAQGSSGDAELDALDASMIEAEAQAAGEEARASVSVTSIPDYDENSFQKQIDEANTALANAEDGVAKAQDALDKAQAAADKRTVTAPMAGTVLSLAAKQGAGVGGGSAAAGATSKASTTSLAEVADLSQMKVTINVNEVDISSVAVGQEADVTFSALPDISLKAEVVSVASTTGGASGDAGAAAGGASGGSVASYPVELVIKKPDSRLKPGMTANAVIKTQEVKDVIIAPTMGVSEQDGKHYVTVITDNGDGTFESEQREVEVGEHNSTDTVIKSGLNEGEQVSLEADSGATGGDAADAEVGRG